VINPEAVELVVAVDLLREYAIHSLRFSADFERLCPEREVVICTNRLLAQATSIVSIFSTGSDCIFI
jgi:hypothetical protein